MVNAMPIGCKDEVSHKKQVIENKDCLVCKALLSCDASCCSHLQYPLASKSGTAQVK